MLLANIFGFGNPMDVAIIAGVVVLLFGGSKIPGLFKSLGEGMKEFKKATREITEDDTATKSSAQPMMEHPVTPSADGTTHTAEAAQTQTPVGSTTKE
jgi:sec-independent protein translocase protein TatA